MMPSTLEDRLSPFFVRMRWLCMLSLQPLRLVISTCHGLLFVMGPIYSPLMFSKVLKSLGLNRVRIIKETLVTTCLWVKSLSTKRERAFLLTMGSLRLTSSVQRKTTLTIWIFKFRLLVDRTPLVVFLAELLNVKFPLKNLLSTNTSFNQSPLWCLRRGQNVITDYRHCHSLVSPITEI